MTNLSGCSTTSAQTTKAASLNVLSAKSSTRITKNSSTNAGTVQIPKTTAQAGHECDVDGNWTQGEC